MTSNQSLIDQAKYIFRILLLGRKGHMKMCQYVSVPEGQCASRSVSSFSRKLLIKCF